MNRIRHLRHLASVLAGLAEEVLCAIGLSCAQSRVVITRAAAERGTSRR